MIAWTIQAALSANCFARVLVSTDDEEIAEISRSFGAEVPFLRQEAADDFSHVSQATVGAIAQAEAFWGEKYETVVQLMPNCPLRGDLEILDALRNFESREGDFQISCFEYGWMNPWWAAELDDKGFPSQLFEGALKKRSQDLPKVYCPTGAIWIAKVNALKCAGKFYGPGHHYYPMKWDAAVDIDDAEDLKMAKSVLIMKNIL